VGTKWYNGNQNLEVGSSEEIGFASYETGLPNTTKTTFGIMPTAETPPKIALCLVCMDMNNKDRDVRVQTYVEDVQVDKFTLSLGTWGDRELYRAGVSMMRIPSSELAGNFRMGTSKHTHGEDRIVFDPPFKPGVTPTIFIGLSSIDNEGNWRFSAEVTQATENWFKLDVNTWGSSNLYKCEIQWIAFPSDLPGVETGTFIAKDADFKGRKQLSKLFNTIPTVLTGITYMDVGPEASLRLRAKAASSEVDSVDWSVESWGDSAKYVYEVRGSFLAFST